MKTNIFICAICFHAEPCFRVGDKVDGGISLIPSDGLVNARQHVCKDKTEEHFTLIWPPKKIVGLFGENDGK